MTIYSLNILRTLILSCPYKVQKYNFRKHKLEFRPCGKCLTCRIDNRQRWEYRLYQHLKKYNYIGSFVTMTYADQCYDVRRGLNTRHLQLFHKSFRKMHPELDYDYYTVGEYGGKTARCHYHSLMFGVSPLLREDMFKCWHLCEFDRFTVTPILPSRIRYTLKYMDKESFSRAEFSEETKDVYQPFEYDIASGKLLFNIDGLISPRAWISKGIGNDFFCEHLDELYFKGKYTDGMTEYKPSKYQIDALTHNDIFFQLRRSSFFSENSYIQNRISNEGLEQFFVNSAIESLNKEFSMLKQSERSGDSVSFDLFNKNSDKCLQNVKLAYNLFDNKVTNFVKNLASECSSYSFKYDIYSKLKEYDEIPF